MRNESSWAQTENVSVKFSLFLQMWSEVKWDSARLQQFVDNHSLCLCVCVSAADRGHNVAAFSVLSRSLEMSEQWVNPRIIPQIKGRLSESFHSSETLREGQRAITVFDQAQTITSLQTLARRIQTHRLLYYIIIIIIMFQILPEQHDLLSQTQPQDLTWTSKMNQQDSAQLQARLQLQVCFYCQLSCFVYLLIFVNFCQFFWSLNFILFNIDFYFILKVFICI